MFGPRQGRRRHYWAEQLQEENELYRAGEPEEPPGKGRSGNVNHTTAGAFTFNHTLHLGIEIFQPVQAFNDHP